MWTSRREDIFSSFFRSSPNLQYPPEFSWILLVMSQMCSLQHVHLGQRSKMQYKELTKWHTWGLLNSLHSAEVIDSHFKICFNDFIYPPWVQTIRKSPDTPDKSGEICFGLVKYFNFFLIKMFKFLQKYKLSGKLKKLSRYLWVDYFTLGWSLYEYLLGFNSKFQNIYF